jgi:hypothetical protein
VSESARHVPHTIHASKVCPVCGVDCTRVAVEDLLYTWEPDPEAPNTLCCRTWHRSCYLKSGGRR